MRHLLRLLLPENGVSGGLQKSGTLDTAGGPVELLRGYDKQGMDVQSSFAM